MQVRIDNPQQLGHLIRAVRKAQGLRQDDAAGSVGVSENFLGKVERGSDAVQWGKLFAVMQGLGLRLNIDVPGDIAEHLPPTP